MADHVGSSLKATLRYGSADDAASPAFGSLTGTLAGLSPARVTPIDLGETVAADSMEESGVKPGSGGSMTTTAAGRTTVLPRRRAQGAAPEGDRPRFDRVRLLGEGGMGQVELVRDNDIRRTVAVKRLHGDAQSTEAVLRFADEVRIVGQLEHPSIVPVYDVGRDEAGQVYLVMKHLNGETMEHVIERLRAKDPAYVARYSIEHRVHLFLSVLDAIRYAHARGVIHRDLKPANVMIGPYGEVTVLDWGIAKPIRRKSDGQRDVEPLDRTAVDTHDSRLQETQFGSLAGTPLYMSPEQAAGRNDDLDERSDVFALSVLFYEWLFLHHPLEDKKTVSEVLAAIISGEVASDEIIQRALFGGVPAEWMRVIMKGVVRDREARLPSVEALENEVRKVLDGHVKIECHVTFTKRVVHEALALIDRHPKIYLVVFVATVLGLVLALGWGGYRLVHAVL